jgi:hypothetical protein
VSVENQAAADERLPQLLKIQGTRIIMLEPLLEQVDLPRSPRLPDLRRDAGRSRVYGRRPPRRVVPSLPEARKSRDGQPDPEDPEAPREGLRRGVGSGVSITAKAATSVQAPLSTSGAREGGEGTWNIPGGRGDGAGGIVWA